MDQLVQRSAGTAGLAGCRTYPADALSSSKTTPVTWRRSMTQAAFQKLQPSKQSRGIIEARAHNHPAQAAAHHHTTYSTPSRSRPIFTSFDNWLKEDHASTELNRWLKARGVNLPDYLHWLPKPLHDKLHYAEDEFFLLFSEALLVFFAFVAYKRVENVLRGAHWLWHHKIVKDDRKTDQFIPDFECTVYGALSGPIKASIAMMELTHLFTLFTPFLRTFGENNVALFRKTSFTVLAFWFLLRWKDTWFQRAKIRQIGQKEHMIALDKLSTLALGLLGVLVTGEVAGVALKSLLALGGVSGIAIGLAARDVVGNLFGGTMIYITRPFTIGDAIKAGNVGGAVLDIGFYSTKLLNSDRQPIYVPNAYFTNQVIVNFSRQQNRVLQATFTLRHQDLPLIEDISNKICALLLAHDHLDPSRTNPSVWLTSLSPLSLELSIMAVFKQVSSDEFNKIRHSILVKSAQIIQVAGAAMSPYPCPPGPLVNPMPVTVNS